MGNFFCGGGWVVGRAGADGGRGQYKLGLNGKDAQDLETFRFSWSNKNVKKKEKSWKFTDKNEKVSLQCSILLITVIFLKYFK